MKQRSPIQLSGKTNKMKLHIKHIIFSFACCVTGLFATAQNTEDTARTQKEEDFFKIITVPIPSHVALEVGGMTFLPDDELAVCTRHGEVWGISNPYMKNGLAPRYRRIAEGLHEALGLNYLNGDLYVTQRSELTKLKDLDGDGEADEYKTICTWPLSGNYHEYSYGPIQDKKGNLYVALNLGWTDNSVSLSKWHGWMLRIDPQGKMKPFATGFRSPAGFNFNKEGDIFYSENQGHWVGSGYIANVEENDFMGNPQGLKWAGEPGSSIKLRLSDIPDTDEPKYDVAKRVPGLKPPAVWFPQSILGISTSGILSYEDKGKMGPFEGQLFVGDQGQSKIMRVDLEKIKGLYQGVSFPFREGFSSGILRMVWGSDGSMFVGMTSRGWGSTGPAEYGLQRLEWNGKIPFEMKTIRARPDGFEIEFTQPVDEKRARNVNSYDLTSFTYKYGSKYGSPVINEGSCPIKAISISPDKLKLRLVVDSMRLGYIHEIKAAGVRSAENFALLHNLGYYTLNNFPDGEKLAITADNKVQKVMDHQHMNMAGKEKNIKVVSAASIKHLVKQPAGWTKGAEQTILLNPVPGLKYNITAVTVKAGTKVKLTFKNSDDMLHNVVITMPNAADEVGSSALKMGLKGERMSYVPASPKVLFHTTLLQPGTAETIYFTAPDKPGDYPYECTYPGHYLVMRGVMKVVSK
jgi:azurin/glucose/arabinose dehydrogenase